MSSVFVREGDTINHSGRVTFVAMPALHLVRRLQELQQ